MSLSERTLSLIGENPEHEQLILLAALSVLWLEPQSPHAAELLRYYRQRDLPFAALRETALQLFLLAGFQASLEAAFQIEEIYGHGLSERNEDVSTLDAQSWYARGKELQASVYRGNVEKLRVNLDRVSTELSVWTVLVGYGLVMSRPGLAAHYRELLEIVVLVVQGFPRQLHSHLRGALTLGASRDEVEKVLEVSCLFAEPDRHAFALRMWHKIS